MEDDGSGYIAVWPNDAPMDEISLEFGELLYQLRATLDSLVYELAIIDSGSLLASAASRARSRGAAAVFAGTGATLMPLAARFRLQRRRSRWCPTGTAPRR